MFFNDVKNLTHRILLNNLDPRSTRFTPFHLLWSPRSPLLGTGATWPSCRSEKSFSPSQYAMKYAWSAFRLSQMKALKASGGISLIPRDFPLASLLTAWRILFHEMGTSRSSMTVRFRTSSSASYSTCRCFWNTPARCGAITDTFSSSVEARLPSGNHKCITVGWIWWLVRPISRIWTLCHASFGKRHMMWIMAAWWASHAAFASAMLSVTSTWTFCRSALRASTSYTYRSFDQMTWRRLS